MTTTRQVKSSRNASRTIGLNCLGCCEISLLLFSQLLSFSFYFTWLLLRGQPITYRSTQPILQHLPLFLPHNRLLNRAGQVNGQRNWLFFFSVHSSCNLSVHSSVNFFPTICPSTQPLTHPRRLSKRTKICPVQYELSQMVLNFSIRNGKRWFHHCMNVDISI